MRVFCVAVNRVGRRTDPEWRDVRPRQFESWWKDSLLRRPPRPGRGRGRGRVAIYEAALVLDAVEVASLVRRHNTDVAALILYARDRDINPERVRRAYLSRLARQHEDLIEAARTGIARYAVSNDQDEMVIDIAVADEPREAAEWAEPVLTARITDNDQTRELRRLLREEGQQPSAHLAAAMADGAMAALGAPPDAADMFGMLALLGFTSPDAPYSVREAAESVRTEWSSAMTFDKVEAAIKAATPDRFNRAREIRKHFHGIRAAFMAAMFTPEESIAFDRAIARAEAFGDPDLGCAQDLLGFIVMMEYELLPRRTE